MTYAALKKHVAIIHAYSSMSALQRKIINVLLHEALICQSEQESTDSIAVECRTSYSNLKNKIHFNSNNLQYLKESIDGLASITIEWNLLKDKVPGNISYLNLRFLQGSPTFYTDGTFNFSFHKIMLDMVRNPEIYGIVDLDIQGDFESKYAHSLYENCTRFVNLNSRKTIKIDIFRKLLGADSNAYQDTRVFKRNILKPAIEESNERANFIIEIEDVKLGRSVTGFDLTVKQKTQKATNTFLKHTINNTNLCSLIKENFPRITSKVLMDILEKYPEKYILEKIDYTKNYAKEESPGKYPAAYFISALKNDYKSGENTSLPTSKDCQKHPFGISDWERKKRELAADLEHWKARSEEVLSPELMNQNKQILDACIKKFNDHLVAKPKQTSGN